MSDRHSTAGTNTRAILSATRCTGALLPWASCTILIICASMVLSPVAWARKRIVPCFSIVPANTLSLSARRAGVGSPVIMLSSI